MSDKYGYIGIETLLNFCSNQKDHCITPNDFMRMNRVKIPDRPHGKWIKVMRDDLHFDTAKCSICHWESVDSHFYITTGFNFCPNCGTPMNEKALEILRKREGETND